MAVVFLLVKHDVTESLALLVVRLWPDVDCRVKNIKSKIKVEKEKGKGKIGEGSYKGEGKVQSRTI